MLGKLLCSRSEGHSVKERNSLRLKYSIFATVFCWLIRRIAVTNIPLKMNNYEIVLSVISITLLMLLLVSGLAIVLFQPGRQRLKQRMELTQSNLKYGKELRQM